MNSFMGLSSELDVADAELRKPLPDNISGAAMLAFLSSTADRYARLARRVDDVDRASSTEEQRALNDTFRQLILAKAELVAAHAEQCRRYGADSQAFSTILTYAARIATAVAGDAATPVAETLRDVRDFDALTTRIERCKANFEVRIIAFNAELTAYLRKPETVGRNQFTAGAGAPSTVLAVADAQDEANPRKSQPASVASGTVLGRKTVAIAPPREEHPNQTNTTSVESSLVAGPRTGVVDVPPVPIEIDVAAIVNSKEHEEFMRRTVESAERLYAKYPWLSDETNSYRKQLDSDVVKARTDPRYESIFKSPDWPEKISHEIGIRRTWWGPDGRLKTEEGRTVVGDNPVMTGQLQNAAQKPDSAAASDSEKAAFAAEVAKSWGRIFAAFPELSDRSKPSHEQFQKFLYELRDSGTQNEIFSRADWPERTIELWNRQRGSTQ
jgi:hypothetical protein